MTVEQVIESLKNRNGVPVVCIRGNENAGLHEGKNYMIRVLCKNYVDYTGKEGFNGVIIQDTEMTYPFVWDISRFELV